MAKRTFGGVLLGAVLPRRGTVLDVKTRRVILGIVMFLMILLLVAPVFILKDMAQKVSDNAPAAQLSAIAKSLAGDDHADALAAKGLARATRITVDGTERFRIEEAGSCWEVEPSKSDVAYRC